MKTCVTENILANADARIKLTHKRQIQTEPLLPHDDAHKRWCDRCSQPQGRRRREWATSSSYVVIFVTCSTEIEFRSSQTEKTNSGRKRSG